MRRLITALGVLAALLGAAAAQQPQTVTLGYLAVPDDPRHAARESYARIVFRPAVVPLDGVHTALREARIVGRALGLEFKVEAREAAGVEEHLAAIDALAGKHGTAFFLIDLPPAMTAELAARTRRRPITLLNVSAVEDELRGRACAPHLFHTIPSQAMLGDALAQHLAQMHWRRILALVGPAPDDDPLAASLGHSLRRFGGQLVATRRFAAGSDPRQREQTNVRLLTQGVEYDVVLIVDTHDEIGRTLPYQTVLPRPVVGTHGLAPVAWHWAFERHGAPQLNQRFARQVQGARPMADAEFAAWAAVRAVVEAYTRAPSRDRETVLATLRDEATTFDLYKGAPASFRPWDNQLRQPILLTTTDAVIVRAPVEGFLHARNNLDTLGRDAPETDCRF